MSNYAIYHKKAYPLTIRAGVLRLRSTKKESGFEELVDLAGNRHEDIFIKEVEIDIEMAYELKVNAIYKGKEFETFSIGPSCLEKIQSLCLVWMKMISTIIDLKNWSNLFSKKMYHSPT